ncbi:YopX family protein [Streptococcus uberis]|nr:YopX family protein [Streptococcus uberis]MCK1200552.1 YopX family protein [Streptococcus uberis]
MILKYRAWDTVKKAMHDVQAIVYTEEKVYPIYSKKIRRYIPFGEAILMQSTGLFDKNGVEIFESDIIRHTDLYLNSETIDKVYFKDGSFMYNVVVDKYTYNVPIREILDNSTVEVIGNVYQTPNLLETEEV